jgi:hypothetical protein
METIIKQFETTILKEKKKLQLLIYICIYIYQNEENL